MSAARSQAKSATTRRRTPAKEEQEEAPSSQDQKRTDNITQHMSPELGGICVKIQRLLVSSHQRELKTKLFIGRLIKQIQSKPNKYGKKGVETVAEALGVDASSLYDYAKVATCWSKEDLKDLQEKRSIGGLPISFSHLLEIAVLHKKVQRRSWVNRVLKEGLSVRRLRQLLRDDGAVEANDTEEQEQAGPATWVRGLQELVATTEATLSQVHKVGAVLGELPREAVAEKERSLLEKAREAQEKLRDQCEQNIERIKAALDTKPSK